MRSIVRRLTGRRPRKAPKYTGCPPGRAAPETLAGVPSIHAAWNGSYSFSIDGHSPLKLEDEVFVALNAGHVLSARGRRDPGACLLSVYFAPDLLSAALEGLATVDRELLLACSQDRNFPPLRARARQRPFARLRDALHRSSRLRWHRRSGVARGTGELPAAAAARTGSVPGARRQRHDAHEVLEAARDVRAAARVTDLIHSCYERPLTIEELAGAAHWSRFHMMREFKAVHGISPYEYLVRTASGSPPPARTAR